MGMPQLETPATDWAHRPEPTPTSHSNQRPPASSNGQGKTSGKLPRSQRGLTFSTTILEDPNLLSGFGQQIDALATASSEANIFYEPWMLLPSLKAFGRDHSFLFVLVFVNQSGTEPLLCGFFPLQLVNRTGGFPIRCYRLWNYLSFRWCPPLVRAGYEAGCLKAFFQWARSNANLTSLIEFRWCPAPGRQSQALIDIFNREGFSHYISDVHTRAMLRKADCAETCIRAAIPGSKIKELNRLQRRLAEKGELRYERLTDEGEVAEWIEGFLNLESKGWKGRSGTALACSREQRQFFEEIVRSAFDRGQLMMLRLSIGNRTVAYKCNFVSGVGAFAFKIAYDETYSAFSPGVQLELENIRQFHSMAEVEWMDSCADADHFMANHLWADRRTIQTTLIAPHGGFGSFWLSVMPFLKWIRHTLRSAIHNRSFRGAQ